MIFFSTKVNKVLINKLYSDTLFTLVEIQNKDKENLITLLHHTNCRNDLIEFIIKKNMSGRESDEPCGCVLMDNLRRTGELNSIRN